MRAPEFWSDNGPLPALLAPLGAGYDLAGRLRRALVRPVAVPVPVVCAGNLVAGGAGKTPVALALLAALSARGHRPHALTRGYGGRSAGPLRVDPARHDFAKVGDEALLLARVAPTWVARDRVAGARAAVAAGADSIVMDDGFQNPSLAKDLSLLVVDGAYGFGNARVMPAGPLRERIEAGLVRADAVVVLDPDAGGLAAQLGPRTQVMPARLAPRPEAGRLAGQRVLAFAGIGRPQKFFASLSALGAEVVEQRAFPDHHPYDRRDIEALLARARDQDAVAVTTEKDAVRLPPDLLDRIEVVAAAIEWHEPEALAALLDRLPSL